jgi:hypothetical protein
MARPIKDSLSYFPLDTDFFSDRRIKRLLKTFGGKGTTIYIFLLCEVYRNNGYFVQYDNDYPEDIASALGEGFNLNLVSDVTEFCLDCGLFDRELFSKFGILTSAAIQRRYISAKEATGKKAYTPESLLRADYISRGFTGYNEEERGITEKNTVKRGFPTKRKVKESKVKEIKEEEEEEKKPPSSSSSKNTFEVSDFFPEHEAPTPEVIPDDAKDIHGQLLKALNKISLSPEEILIGEKLISTGCTFEDIEAARKEKNKNNLKYLRNIVCEVRDRRIQRKEAEEYEPEIY